MTKVQQNNDSGLLDMVLKNFNQPDNGKEFDGSYLISYEEIPMACCRVDLNGFILDCNEMFASFFNKSTTALISISLLDLIDSTSYERVDKILESFINAKKGSMVETKASFKRRDGGMLFAILRFKPVFGHHDDIVALNVLVIDDTFNYRKLEQIEKDKQELEKKERMKDEFIAVASHELRTPIQPLLGFALLAKKKMISEEKAWDGILAEARKLQQLTNDILDVTRIETGTLRYKMANEKINELLSQIVESLKPGLKDEVSLSLTYDEIESAAVAQIDRIRITQLITNIIGNAIKFTEKGTIKVESKVNHEKNFIEISISDSGKGIPKEMLPRLFEKFATQGHGDGQNKGTGLGLYISKAIAAAHHGGLTAFNNPEGGATFSLSLPLTQGKAE